MWCNDPDKAFDIGCCNLGSEDWCKDNSNCPIQRKDTTMFILVKKEINTKELEKSGIVIQVNQDKKTFSVLKHRYMETNDTYHMSHLKNILLTNE